MKLTKEIMYKAILEKDTTFEGLFFTAVKTTRIFCRPSCSARKPKFENVEFLMTSDECIREGYRACKICKPLETLSHTPIEYAKLMSEISRDPSKKFKDSDLRSLGIEPSQIRRWFMKNYGVTFHSYQRLFRVNSAAKRLGQGVSVTETAFNAGYESLSGFGDSFKNIVGVSPKNGTQQKILDSKRIETPLGTMLACANPEGICFLEFTDRASFEAELSKTAKLLEAIVLNGRNDHIENLEAQLTEYFDGKRREFSIPLSPIGTEFQVEVWSSLLQIPYGQTISYKEQAIRIGRPGSVRAVANANGMNRIPILIPCHRVIGSNGKLTGYAGGIWRKRHLLELEEKFS